MKILNGLTILLMIGLAVMFLSGMVGSISVAIFGFFLALLSFIIIIIIIIKQRIEQRRDEDDFSKY